MSETKTVETAQDTTKAASADKTIYPDKVEKTEAASSQGDANQSTNQSADKNQSETKTSEDKQEPAKLELKLPEGSLLTPAQVEAVTSFAKEKGLTPDVAQMVLERESNAILAFASEQQTQQEKQIQQWVKDAESDKEIGGASFKESAHLAAQVAKKFGSEQLIKELNDSGYGNHPELIRLLARIGKQMDNAKLIMPNSGAANGVKSAASVLYPSRN
jgi:hypothetical protein